MQGLRKNIQNHKPIIGPYGVHKAGSGDMYYKGANLVHIIRQIINNDEKFRQILRGLNKEFFHRTVSSRDIEAFINRQIGIDFSSVFNQYLRTATIPVLEFRQSGNRVQYRWANTIAGFNMPVRLQAGQWISPSTTWQTVQLKEGVVFNIDKNFYINLRKL